MPENPKQPDPSPADEPETFELAFDPEEDQPAPPPAKPKKPPSKPSAKPRASSEPDTIPLEDLEPEIHDPRAGNTPSRPRKPIVDPDSESSDAPEEPKTVSPAKARRAREDERIRATQELAEADARRKKIILIAVGAIALVGIVVFAAFKFL